ncbi:MAG TPA: DUF1588 domain-containing protein [Planctomycetota bacterium]|nr:DUF1588 domain-containing protein [Planctomycetota bacterium]
MNPISNVPPHPRLPGAQTHRIPLLPGAVAIVFAAALAFPSPPAAAQERPEEDRESYTRTVEPFLRQHCLKCHGPEKQKGKLALHTLRPEASSEPDRETWKRVAERLSLGEMPPESEKRPDPLRTQQVIDWIKRRLSRAGVDTAEIDHKLLLPSHGNRVDHDALFSAPLAGVPATPARLWRLGPRQYAGLVSRLAGRSVTPPSPFSFNAGEGFLDYADLYRVDEPTVNQLIVNARQIVEIQCGLQRSASSVREFKALIDPQREPSESDIQQAVRKQFQMALLREPSREESARFLEFYRKTLPAAGRTIAVRDTLASILLLPEALYRHELGQGPPDRHGRVLLAPRELAYAIAFALTHTGPDAALLKAAETGKLASAEDVRREVRRLLDDDKIAKPRLLEFFEEYFEFTRAADVFKDLERGAWRPEVLINDTRLLIRDILQRDQDVLRELLTTPKSFVNYRPDPKNGAKPAFIANQNPRKDRPRAFEYWELYGLPADWTWTDRQPVELDARERAGILTQPSWLAAFATNNENHPIRRGKWIRERLLGGYIPDLPITVDAQLPDRPDQTLRQRLEVTRQEYCWQCHQKMNPLGLAFEAYDYLGRFRTTERIVDPSAPPAEPSRKGAPPKPAYREVPVDSGGRIDASGDPRLDGEVRNAVAMIRKLADSPRVRQVFVRHAFRFWLGRNETPADAASLRAADRAYVESGGSLKALLIALLSSDSFIYRKP